MRATIAAMLAAVAAVAADQCSVVTNPAPCGQQSDTELQCVQKGCCYNPAFKQVPCFYPSYDAVNITTVHVIQACHFDAGFADTTVNILNRWFTQHFPMAHTIGENLTAMGNPNGAALRFMAQSWIVSLYLDCPPNAGLACPTPAELATFTDSINKGYITWHAWPHNGEFELADRHMIEYGLSLSHEIDDQFGLPRKATVSQRDVPGTTRASIPILQQLGVQAISVGVNGASQPPKVPRAFIWRDEASNTSIPAMWHPYGYGGITFEDAVVIPGLEHAFIPDWRGDNAGPPQSTTEVESDWAAIRTVFPGATIVASTMDNFTQLLNRPDVMAKLPVVTSEIGDTWLHGSISDPQKSSWFKVGQKLRSDCIESGQCDVNDYAFRNFSRFMVKNEEHTWGKDIKTFLHDTTHWTNTDFQTALSTNMSNFWDVLQSWHEQRDWGMKYAIDALPTSSPLKQQLIDAFNTLHPGPAPVPASNGWAPASAGQQYTVGRYTMTFDSVTGAIAYLHDAGTASTWANQAVDGSKLGWFEYLTYSVQDYTDFINNYCALQPPPSWFLLDFGKPNMTIANPVHYQLPQSLSSLWSITNNNAGVQSFLVGATVGDGSQHTNYGAPAMVWTQYDVSTSTDPSNPASSTINVTVMVYNKTATRLPEAMFFRFNASGSDTAADPSAWPWPIWAADKIGSWVNPFDVVMGGNKYHQGVGNRGIMASKPATQGGSSNITLQVSTPDAIISSWGAPRGLPTPHNVTMADPSEGGSFMLTNNMWGTNYPMWIPFDAAADSNLQWHFGITFGTS